MLVLPRLARHVKPDIRPPLKVIHKEKRLIWASEYMKSDFKVVLFTDDYTTTLDGTDAWSKGSVANGRNSPIRVGRQQGGGGIMFWAGIIGNELSGPWKVPVGVKITSVA